MHHVDGQLPLSMSRAGSAMCRCSNCMHFECLIHLMFAGYLHLLRESTPWQYNHNADGGGGGGAAAELLLLLLLHFIIAVAIQQGAASRVSAISISISTVTAAFQGEANGNHHCGCPRCISTTVKLHQERGELTMLMGVPKGYTSLNLMVDIGDSCLVFCLPASADPQLAANCNM